MKRYLVDVLVLFVAAMAIVLSFGCDKPDADMRICEITLTRSSSWNGDRTYVREIGSGDVRWYYGMWGERGDTLLVDFNKGERPK